MSPYTLTPAVVQTLRDSVRWRGSDGSGAVIAIPWLCWGEAEEVYILHAYGHTQATSTDPEPLLACLRCERAEPGFIRRILDAREDCTVASLTPDLLAAERRRKAGEELRQRLAAADKRALSDRMAELRRTALTKPVTDISLDDLLG